MRGYRIVIKIMVNAHEIFLHVEDMDLIGGNVELVNRRDRCHRCGYDQFFNPDRFEEVESDTKRGSITKSIRYENNDPLTQQVRIEQAAVADQPVDPAKGLALLILQVAMKLRGILLDFSARELAIIGEVSRLRYRPKAEALTRHVDMFRHQHREDTVKLSGNLFTDQYTTVAQCNHGTVFVAILFEKLCGKQLSSLCPTFKIHTPILPVTLCQRQGIMNSMKYYEVAPTKVVRASSAVFTYHASSAVPVGTIVRIPIGKSHLLGVVIREVKKPAYDTKALEATTIPALPRALVATALWMSEYYATHLATVLQTVLPRGLDKKRRASKKTPVIPRRNRTHFLLNASQTAAVEAINTLGSGTALLHGITGSGKTAAYIKLAQQAIEQGRSAIVLVPEIALTSQLVAEFTEHFPDIILTHSRQTEAERHQAWLAAATATKPQVVIGPRSALFMPLARVGSIIIDEAHEPSFKQDQSPRYSALRVASVLAKEHGTKVVQGSATPLVSEYYFLQAAGQPIIHMDKKARPDVIEPTVSTIDMTKKSDFTTHRLFSNALLSSITATVESGNQVLIFHNRRGSASTTLCESCGWSSLCPRCFVPLTLHADRHRLECHICGTHERVPTSCPVCGSTDIIHKGIGTKLIESELRKLFPKAAIARFDGDASNEDTVEKRYQELYDGTISIIVGTQVIAKGLDLPKLRVVGVVQADAGLALPDFAASERTFQLLAQVVGRVGRSEHPTDVIVQSYQPSHPAVQLGVAQDYLSFYNHAIAERQRGLFPPFTYLLKLTCVYKTEAAAIRNAQALTRTIRQKHPDVIIFGPTPAFYERQHDTYRWQIIIKSPKRARLLEIMEDVPATHWQTNLDPMSLL